MVSEEFIQKHGGEEFRAKLLKSRTIEVVCPHGSHCSNTDCSHQGLTHFPEVLACAVSKYFRSLCRESDNLHFDMVVELFEHRRWNYCGWEEDCDKECDERERDRPQFDWTPTCPFISHFANCLYTSKQSRSDNISYYDMWGFSEKIGAPELQNAASQMLGSDTERGKDKGNLASPQYYFRQGGYIKACWRETDFSGEDMNELLNHDGVFWQTHKRLLFMLDCAVWMGSDHEDVQQMVRRGGDLALHIMERMIATAGNGGVTEPPWSLANIKKYCTLSTRRSRSELRSSRFQESSSFQSAGWLL